MTGDQGFEVDPLGAPMACDECGTLLHEDRGFWVCRGCGWAAPIVDLDRPLTDTTAELDRIEARCAAVRAAGRDALDDDETLDIATMAVVRCCALLEDPRLAALVPDGEAELWELQGIVKDVLESGVLRLATRDMVWVACVETVPGLVTQLREALA